MGCRSSGVPAELELLGFRFGLFDAGWFSGVDIGWPSFGRAEMEDAAELKKILWAAG